MKGDITRKKQKSVLNGKSISNIADEPILIFARKRINA